MFICTLIMVLHCIVKIVTYEFHCKDYFLSYTNFIRIVAFKVLYAGLPLGSELTCVSNIHDNLLHL